jgi:ABC-type multidrug transport system ATPase subunit
MLERLPQGMQTSLGGEGRFLSGGEGQRVRFGRAMQRPDARLVIMDEAFRGLDRDKRRELLARARAFWPQATLICITHDVGQTQDFERVLVIEEGRLVEDGIPGVLLSQPASRYRTLIAAEEAVRETLWASGEWRRLWLENGQLDEMTPSLQAPAEVDDLQRVNGIGPVFATRLQQAGIRTLSDLALLSPERIVEIVASGRTTHLIKPQDWIEQARQLIERSDVD